MKHTLFALFFIFGLLNQAHLFSMPTQDQKSIAIKKQILFISRRGVGAVQDWYVLQTPEIQKLTLELVEKGELRVERVYFNYFLNNIPFSVLAIFFIKNIWNLSEEIAKGVDLKNGGLKYIHQEFLQEFLKKSGQTIPSAYHIIITNIVTFIINKKRFTKRLSKDMILA